MTREQSRAATGALKYVARYGGAVREEREIMERAVRGMRRSSDIARRRHNEVAEKFRLELLRGGYGKADGAPLFKV